MLRQHEAGSFAQALVGLHACGIGRGSRPAFLVNKIAGTFRNLHVSPRLEFMAGGWPGLTRPPGRFLKEWRAAMAVGE
jgi:hypothetical protein